MVQLERLGLVLLLLGAACSRDGVALGPEVDLGSDLAPAGDLIHLSCTDALGTPTSFKTDSSSVWFSTLADFNQDGILDVAVTNAGTAIGEPFPGVADHTVGVFMGKGDGSFQAEVDYPTGDGPIGVQAADLNGDGKPDLVVGNGGPNGKLGATVSVLLNKGDGSFTPHKTYATGTGPYGLVLADFNGDGARDIAVTNESDNTVSILLGRGDGTFQDQAIIAVGVAPLSLVAVDFNKDGHVDLAVANNGTATAASVSILLGRGDGSFEALSSVPTDRSNFGVASGDFNKDGNTDLAVTNIGFKTVNVLMGNGDGTFASKLRYGAGLYPIAVGIADIDADGYDDLLVANSGDNNIGVLLNRGDGTLADMVTYSSVAGNRLTIGDVNHDGKPDVVTPVSTLLNACP